ncbi:Hypothetical_protein [Hexamita inflata]|uniref:Hypothetical_protein n=1 Tax=Hexamita inflata TaxID=28002 RepID=A0AA86U541_9EUKA|nr:Hypothetical protein HINF_LOCUS28874 [Hexamita inflata]
MSTTIEPPPSKLKLKLQQQESQKLFVQSHKIGLTQTTEFMYKDPKMQPQPIVDANHRFETLKSGVLDCFKVSQTDIDNVLYNTLTTYSNPKTVSQLISTRLSRLHKDVQLFFDCYQVNDFSLVHARLHEEKLKYENSNQSDMAYYKRRCEELEDQAALYNNTKLALDQSEVENATLRAKLEAFQSQFSKVLESLQITLKENEVLKIKTSAQEQYLQMQQLQTQKQQSPHRANSVITSPVKSISPVKSVRIAEPAFIQPKPKAKLDSSKLSQSNLKLSSITDSQVKRAPKPEPKILKSTSKSKSQTNSTLKTTQKPKEPSKQQNEQKQKQNEQKEQQKETKTTKMETTEQSAQTVFVKFQSDPKTDFKILLEEIHDLKLELKTQQNEKQSLVEQNKQQLQAQSLKYEEQITQLQNNTKQTEKQLEQRIQDFEKLKEAHNTNQKLENENKYLKTVQANEQLIHTLQHKDRQLKECQEELNKLIGDVQDLGRSMK